MKFLPVILLYFLKYLDSSGVHGVSWILQRSVEDYYWRDFYGLVPNDAIKGGTDENGATTYIGQFSTPAEYNSGSAALHTVPAVIQVGSNFATAAYAGRALRSNQTTSTKILCHSYANRFKWYPPTAQFPSNCRFVIGGYEDALPMYVGRANHNKQLLIGKIFPDNTNHRPGLICPYKNGEVHFDSYEVLTHCS